LFSVVLNNEFKLAQIETLRDPRTTLADFRTVLKIALESDELVPALGCVGSYRDTIRSANIAQAIFAAVNSRDFDLAQKQAVVYEAVPDWACVLTLYLAWEAAEAKEVEMAERVVSTVGKLPLVQAHGLCDALLVRIAESLAKKEGSLRDAMGWLAELGRAEDNESLLKSYHVAQHLDPMIVQNVMSEIEPRLSSLENSIQEGRAEGNTEYFYGDAEHVGGYAEELRDLLEKIAAHPEGQDAIDRALKVVLINPYPRYRDILLIALGRASLSVPNSSWARERIQLILATGLDREGVTFTFDLPSILLAEAERRHLPAQSLSEYVDRGLNTEDCWGTAARTKSAHAAVLFSQGQEDAALQEVIAADQLNIGMAGYSTLTLLSFADRCYEFGHPEYISNRIWGRNRDLTLLDGAMGVAETVRDSKFRQERASLVQAYSTWSNVPSADNLVNGFMDNIIPNISNFLLSPGSFLFNTAHKLVNFLPTVLSTLIDYDTRMTFCGHMSARCSWPPHDPAWIPLKLMVPMALSDATILDALLARIFRLRINMLSDDEVKEAICICTTSLTTGRPWEFGQWR